MDLHNDPALSGSPGQVCPLHRALLVRAGWAPLKSPALTTCTTPPALSITIGDS